MLEHYMDIDDLHARIVDEETAKNIFEERQAPSVAQWKLALREKGIELSNLYLKQ